jgi:hypothetical protein
MLEKAMRGSGGALGLFGLVKNTINKYGILSKDIYNFDESGFWIRGISTSKVVAATDRFEKPKQIKPNNTK